MIIKHPANQFQSNEEISTTQNSIKKLATRQGAQQAYGGASKLESSVSILKEDLPFVNDWVNYRLFDDYLNALIQAIVEQLDLQEDTKQAFIFNAERSTASLQEMEDWVYLGGPILDDMAELSFAECIELLKHAGHQKAKKMKEKIVDIGMSETLKAKQDSMEGIYKKVVDKAVVIIDLLAAYELSIQELKMDNTAVQFDDVINVMSIDYLQLEEGDRLELEKCITIDVCPTDDITKEFLIKTIVQRGITVKGNLHRKASVIVYRWEEELDD